jgi:cell division protein FtsQ
MNPLRKRSDRELMLRVRANAQTQAAGHAQHAGMIILLGVAGIGSLFLLAYGVRMAGRALFSENPAFVVQNVHVRAHGQLLTESFVKACLPVTVGANLFSVDIEAMRQQFLERASSVERMRVQRRLPDTVEVEVWERRPVAWVDGDRKYVAIDRHGVLFHFPLRSKDLPLLVGVASERVAPGGRLAGLPLDALQAIEAAETAEFMQVFRIRRVEVDPAKQSRVGAMRLELATGELVDFWWDRSGDDLLPRLRYLRDWLLKYEGQGKRIATMDLSFDQYPEYVSATLRQG